MKKNTTVSSADALKPHEEVQEIIKPLLRLHPFVYILLVICFGILPTWAHLSSTTAIDIEIILFFFVTYSVIFLLGYFFIIPWLLFKKSMCYTSTLTCREDRPFEAMLKVPTHLLKKAHSLQVKLSLHSITSGAGNIYSIFFPMFKQKQDINHSETIQKNGYTHFKTNFCITLEPGDFITKHQMCVLKIKTKFPLIKISFLIPVATKDSHNALKENTVF